MKNCNFILLGILLFFGACSKENNAPAPMTQTTIAPGNGGTRPEMRFSGPDYSQAITVDEANWMIQSYLMGINYPTIDENVRSFTFDADTLRTYLNDTTHGKIVTLKFMFAHQPSYAQANFGVPSGLKANALTMVVVGLDEDDRYIYNRNNRVYEHFMPCPNNCDKSGSLLTQPQ